MTHRILSLRALRLGMLAGLAALAACSSAAPVDNWQPVQVDAHKVNKVEFDRAAYTVRFASESAGLSTAETQRLTAFLDDSDVVYGDRVYLEAHAGDNLSQRRQAALRRILARRGVSMTTLKATAAPTGERLALGDELTIEVERYTVMPPACPDWSKPSGGDPTNTVGSNFGCATETNLGMMVASPRDLLVGRQPGPPDAEPGMRAVRNYRAGKASPLPNGSESTAAPSFGGGATGTGAATGSGG